MQPSLPPLVRAWLPHRIGFGTAVYTNGLLIGEVLAVALTIAAGAAAGRRQLAARLRRLGACHASLVAADRAVRWRRAPTNDDRISPRPRGAGGRTGTSAVIWRLGLMLGSVNAMYFATNGFIPDYLHHTPAVPT